MYCYKCGKELANTATYCSRCGTFLGQAAPPPSAPAPPAPAQWQSVPPQYPIAPPQQLWPSSPPPPGWSPGPYPPQPAPIPPQGWHAPSMAMPNPMPVPGSIPGYPGGPAAHQPPAMPGTVGLVTTSTTVSPMPPPEQGFMPPPVIPVVQAPAESYAPAESAPYAAPEPITAPKPSAPLEPFSPPEPTGTQESSAISYPSTPAIPAEVVAKAVEMATATGNHNGSSPAVSPVAAQQPDTLEETGPAPSTEKMSGGTIDYAPAPVAPVHASPQGPDDTAVNHLAIPVAKISPLMPQPAPNMPFAGEPTPDGGNHFAAPSGSLRTKTQANTILGVVFLIFGTAAIGLYLFFIIRTALIFGIERMLPMLNGISEYSFLVSLMPTGYILGLGAGVLMAVGGFFKLTKGYGGKAVTIAAVLMFFVLAFDGIYLGLMNLWDYLPMSIGEALMRSIMIYVFEILFVLLPFVSMIVDANTAKNCQASRIIQNDDKLRQGRVPLTPAQAAPIAPLEPGPSPMQSDENQPSESMDTPLPATASPEDKTTLPPSAAEGIQREE